MSEDVEKVVKPGWKTTEFWLSAATALVGLAMASGLFESGGPVAQGLGLAASALAAMGYSYSRAKAKS